MKKMPTCPHWRHPDTCYECKFDKLKSSHPSGSATIGDLVDMVEFLLERCQNLENDLDQVDRRIPYEEDPQCE